MWATGAALALTLSLAAALLAIVLYNGLGVFWPKGVYLATLNDGQRLLGEVVERETNHRVEVLGSGEEAEATMAAAEQLPPQKGIVVKFVVREEKIPVSNPPPAADGGAGPEGPSAEAKEKYTIRRVVEKHVYEESVKFRVGNMEDGPAFRWVKVADIAEQTLPADAIVLDRTTNMRYYGFLKEIETPTADSAAPSSGAAPPSAPTTSQATTAADSVNVGAQASALEAALDDVQRQYAEQVAPIESEMHAASSKADNRLKYQIMRAEYRRKQLLEGGAAADAPEVRRWSEQLDALAAEKKELEAEADRLSREMQQISGTLRQNVGVFVDAQGREKKIALNDILRFYYPNSMGIGQKIGYYGQRVWELLSADPRESNQDGGLFPAIFGTVLMVFLMAIFCFPLGVLAGVYLGEYAKEGPLVRTVRIAVNNLAGIPSIVYGIFGLGFFIYLVGGQLDQLFFPERVAASEPVFGQGCILWASLTLGLLTIPVVIVSTEEALRAIPRGVREGSYALGATKFQTLARLLTPMSSPGMMTGFILAMARAAGEVAPLMLTGAVKLAQVPLDGNPPYIHLDRQFMHLGFHILDISCKSPNVEATKPMVYVTTLLLLAIVLSLSSAAIFLRNRMRKLYYSRSI